MRLSLLLLPLILPVPALAQATSSVRVSGAVEAVSDARLRGVSQSNLLPALGGSLGVEHRSGLHAEADVMTAAGWGAVGGAPVQLRLTGGWRTELAGAQLAARVSGTVFPGGSGGFVELGGSVGGFLGPLSLTGSIGWAPPQTALGNWSGTAESQPGSSGSNLYLAADAGMAVLGTPLTLLAHVGHSQGSEGLGPQGWALTPTGAYWDWRLGLQYREGAFALGFAWVATDIDSQSLAWRQLQPAFSADGAPISNSRLVVSVSASF